MYISKLQRIPVPAGISRNDRREPADRRRAVSPIVIVDNKADRQRANVALVAPCLIALSLLVPVHPTAVVAALLAVFTAAALRDQQSLDGVLASRRPRHD